MYALLENYCTSEGSTLVEKELESLGPRVLVILGTLEYVTLHVNKRADSIHMYSNICMHVERNYSLLKIENTMKPHLKAFAVILPPSGEDQGSTGEN